MKDSTNGQGDCASWPSSVRLSDVETEILHPIHPLDLQENLTVNGGIGEVMALNLLVFRINGKIFYRTVGAPRSKGEHFIF